MAQFKCKMCGGTLVINGNETVGTCEYCGTQQTLPKLDDDRKANLYDRANHFRRSNEFDKAMGMYERILNEDTTDAEAYWSLVLCRYGIEYVEDPATHKRIPTVNRAQYTSIFDDDNYKLALQYADGYQRHIYEEEAKAINEIQKGILAISQKEEPFDVFICYKETDNSGRRTPDSVLATDLYHQLTQEGFKVFFSRITLEDKLGTEYEPYIFAALHSAKVMVVLGTKPEYFQAVWVRNEWSRFLSLIRAGKEKILIPAYRDMNPYDLPDEFSNLQALDMSRLGFMQDLIRGIKKLAGEEKPTTAALQSDAVTPLLRRAFLFLEDAHWKNADEYCERVLDQEPENGQAYLGKLMAALHVCKEAELANREKPFDDHALYEKAIRFGDAALVRHLQDYNEAIRRREQQAKEVARQKAEQEKARQEELRRQKEAQRQETKKIREEKWKTHAADRKKLCKRVFCAALAVAIVIGLTFWWKTAEQNKQDAYADAVALMSKGDYAGAAEAFAVLGNYEDSAEQGAKAEQILEEARLREEAYVAAVALLEQADYAAAVEALSTIGDYKDSKVRLKEAEVAAKKEGDYQKAVELTETGEYKAAMAFWNTLGDYRDSREQYAYCGTQLTWARFRSCIDDLEVAELEKAANYLKAMTAYDTEDARTYEDDGYYELAELAYAADRVDLAEACLTAIVETDRFDNYVALTEEVQFLKLYQEAQSIEVKDNETKIALQALIDQLPEDYRDVASLRQKIADYDEAVRLAEETRKREAEEAAMELPITEENIIGTWRSEKSGSLIIFYENGYFNRIEFAEKLGRELIWEGTYSLNGNTLHMHIEDRQSNVYHVITSLTKYRFCGDGTYWYSRV